MDKVGVPSFFSFFWFPRELYARRAAKKQFLATCVAVGVNPVAQTWDFVNVLEKHVPELKEWGELTYQDATQVVVLHFFGTYPLGREAAIAQALKDFEESLQNQQKVAREILQSEDSADRFLLRLPELLERRDGVRKAISDMDMALECAAQSRHALLLVTPPAAAYA